MYLCTVKHCFVNLSSFTFTFYTPYKVLITLLIVETRICLLTTLQPLSRNKTCHDGQKSVTTRGQLTLSMRSLKIELEMSRKSLSIFTYMFTPYAYITSYITKTYLYDFDPLKPRFYIVKLGFTWGTHYFCYFCSKHRLWLLGNSLEPPRRGGSNEYP